MQLSRYIDLAAVAYSTTAANAIEVDTSGCEGVLFIATPASTVARIGTWSFKTAATTTATFVAIVSTHNLASTGSVHDVLIVDYYKPTRRWIQATYTSSAAAGRNLLAFKYGLRKPVTAFSATGVTGLTVPVVAGGVKRLISPSSAT